MKLKLCTTYNCLVESVNKHSLTEKNIAIIVVIGVLDHFTGTFSVYFSVHDMHSLKNVNRPPQKNLKTTKKQKQSLHETEHLLHDSLFTLS